MDSATPPPVPTPAAPPPAAPPPPPASVVHVVERRTGLGRLVAAFVTSIAALAAVFVLGIGAGVLLIGVLGVWLGGSALNSTVVWHTYRDAGPKIVAVVPVRGVIDAERASFVRACVDDILARTSIAAVVLRVDSPGGGVTASDEIWYEVDRLRRRSLPVVASFGAVAASGGYYASCGSDSILAEPTTITGSIGVIAQVLTMEGLMDKIGIEPITLVARRSPRKSVANDIFRTWNDADRAQVMTILDAAYETFHARVRAGRGAALGDEETMDRIADGSVFTAKEAVASGLVDGIGYLDDAIARAEQVAGVATGRATIMLLGERPTLLDELPFAMGAGRRGDLLDAEALRSFVNDLGTVRLMYLMP